MARSGIKVADRARETFLSFLEATGNVSASCREANVTRTTVYRWREADPKFAERWADAEEIAIDALEEAARNRALDTSDRMLEILLKAHRPEKYVEKRITELTGANGGPIQTSIKAENLSDAALAEIMAARVKPD